MLPTSAGVEPATSWRKEIEEIVEEMKESNMEERGTGMKVKKKKQKKKKKKKKQKK